jgi:hypothetical protein
MRERSTPDRGTGWSGWLGARFRGARRGLLCHTCQGHHVVGPARQQCVLLPALGIATVHGFAISCMRCYEPPYDTQ